MLSKANKATTLSWSSSNFGMSHSNSSYQLNGSWNTPLKWFLHITGNVSSNANPPGTVVDYIKYVVNWVEKEVGYNTNTNLTNIDIDYWMCEANSSYSVYSRTNGSGYVYTNFYIKIYEYIFNKTFIPLRPREVANLWEVGYTTLYGKHIDDKYYGGIATGTDTSATTGSITLGNAVGYLKVNYNWNIVKIPYYN